MAHEYDQYVQRFTLKCKQGDYITPANVADVSIMINDVQYTYTDGTLKWDSEKSCWCALLTQEQTTVRKSLNMQGEVTFAPDDMFPTDDVILHTDEESHRLSPSLDWSADDEG